MHNWHRNGFPAEYRGYTVDVTKRGFIAFTGQEGEPDSDWFLAEDLHEIETTIDRIRWDEEQDAEWEREHARAVAAGRRLDATLSELSKSVETVK